MDSYIGELRIFAGSFAPRDWMDCEGQLLSTSLYPALFSLIGTTYGGDGVNTFALPDLRGRIPYHQGSGYTLAQAGGAETRTLPVANLPAHTHAVPASSRPGLAEDPARGFAGGMAWAEGPAAGRAGAGSVGVAGSGAPFGVVGPSLGVRFIICVDGIYPSQY